MYFAISEEKMLELADTAVEAGIELLVMDDGWFRGRNSDTTSLGDWIEDQEKFPEGLQKLAEKVREKGVEFGIWFEPEMVSPESELYKKHPDWVIRSKRYRPIRSRNQLVLDLANPEVREYLIEALSKIFEEWKYYLCKWDMNRHLTDLGSAFLNRENQGELSHRYVWDCIRFWNISQRCSRCAFESCSSGGWKILMQECFIICRRHGQVIIQMLCAD